MTPEAEQPRFNLLSFVPELKLAPRCNGCGFTISLTPAHQRPAGKCPGCRQAVCFYCGCTEEVPCAIAVEGGFIPCHWYAPGTCNVCFERITEMAYRNVCASQMRDGIVSLLVESGQFEEV